ncbi:MAG TPA: NlpC/P60 family protein [Trebonia sp.]|nr:NlpC/P60 family protein [Trebonia sp.]
MAKRLISRTQMRRAAIVGAVLAAASGVAIYTGAAGAGAAPAPTISSVQSEVNRLQGKVDTIGQRYDAAQQQLTAAKGRLAQISKQYDRAEAQYKSASATLAAVAVAAYENSNSTSVLGLLTSGNPDAVLSQASLLLQVEGTHNQQAQQFLTLAGELSTIKAERQHTEEGVAQVKQQIVTQKASLTKLLDKQKTVLESLQNAALQAEVQANTVGGGNNSTTTTTTYTGPTATQAEKAVAFAYAQIGKPYVWGATGPSAYDCSGLVQAAWAAAGVSIPRTTYDMWASLPHIPLSDLQVGDLIEYNGESHVAIYVGDGYIIDAPHTGAVVEKISESTSWYAGSADGALRP